MKKFVVIIAVMAMTMAMASVAMAQVTVDGSIEFLLRSIRNTSDWNDDTTNTGDFTRTYERLRIGFNAKHDGVKGRIQIENDWDTWGDGAGVPTATDPNAANPGFEKRTTNDFYAREAWLDFTIPGAGPAHVKVGRQFLQLGNGWFFRSNKYGSDAWVVGLPGKNTIAFVNVKASENDVSLADDTDAYVLLDTYKISDTAAVGAYITHVIDRRGTWTNRYLFGGAANAMETTHDTIGVHYNGMVGPVKLAAEFNYQKGDIKSLPTATQLPPNSTHDLSGMQAVLQASMAMNALTVRATAAYGTGNDPASTANESEQFITFMDQDPHYTLVYEYFMETAAEGKNTGFANTTALNLGADFKVSNMITVGADFWMLKATEKVSINGDPADTDLGNEVDVKVNAKLYDQLTWNTTIGYFMPGKAYESAGKADDVRAIQSVLSYKF